MSQEESALIDAEVAKMEALFHSADYSALEECAFRFTTQHPKIGFGWSVLGTALQLQNKNAVAAITKAAQLLPNDPIAHNNLGDALFATCQYEQAAACYGNAIAINGEIAEIHNNLGNALRALGHLGDAHASYGRAQNLMPTFAEAHYNQSIAFREQGLHHDAEARLRRAIELKPDFADAHIELGSILKELGRPTEAEVSCRQGLHFKPDFAEAHNNLGAILDELGRVDEAASAFRHAVQLAPESAQAHSNLLFHGSHSEHVSAKELFKAHKEFAERFETVLIPHWLPHPNTRDPHRVIRVGFVSGDFRVHAVANFFEPVLAQLSRSSAVSLYAYSNSSYEDGVTQRLKANVNHWRQIFGMSDERVAQLVRADCIDVLIDLSGHTAHNRLLTFARKPAPVQASWIGYAGTTGLNAVDYYFGDRNCYIADQAWPLEEQYESQFTEKIVRLPAAAPFMPFADAPDVNPLPALSSGHLTFGSFNLLRKLSPTVVGVWAQILRAVPNSRMLLGAMPDTGGNALVIDLFAKEGIARERLSFHPKAQMKDYLSLHHQVDICLDTFPYPGGTTSCHALWMGVPTVTLTGESPVSRVGGALQSHAGLQQFIATNVADYVAKGTYWAMHLGELATIRAGLRVRFGNSPMGQPDVIATSVESALAEMWQQWCKGRPPVSFEVPPSVEQNMGLARTN